MKLVVWLLILWSHVALATTADLKYVLGRLGDNPVLLSAKEDYLRAMLARFYAATGILPTAGIFISKDLNSVSSNGLPLESQSTLQMKVSQPVFSFGSTVVEYQKADKSVVVARNTFLDTEQQVVYNATKAYLSVIRARKVLSINQKNEKYLHEFLEQARFRFEKGESTKTDVALAESRYEGAVSGLINARNSLHDAEAAYMHAVGESPDYELSPPPRNISIPKTMDELMTLVYKDNPMLIRSLYNYRLKQDAVKIAAAKLLPSVSLYAQYSRSPQKVPIIVPGGASIVSSGTVGTLNLSIPIISGGGIDYINLQSAKYEAKSVFYIHQENMRSVSEQTIASWGQLNTSRATMKSNEQSLRAAEIALEGTRKEFLAGFRTSFDVLAAEQQFLDASLKYEESIFSYTLALYSILRMMGILTIEGLLHNI